MATTNDADSPSPPASNSNNDDELTKFSFVRIHGLQSEAGKKLNGACGVVITGKHSNDAGGGKRYAVRIYAKPGDGAQAQGERLVPMDPTEDKKIKAENLTLDTSLAESSVFKDAAVTAMQKEQSRIHGGVASDHNLILWWLKCCYLSWPDDLYIGVSYASSLSKAHKEEEACDIMWELYQKGIVADDRIAELGPQAPAILHEVASAFAHGKKHLEEAMEIAMKIPYEVQDLSSMEGINPENMRYSSKQLANSAFYDISKALDLLIGANPGKEKSEELTRLKIKCSKIMVEREPNDAQMFVHLGGSYCQAGNCLEGARYYRKAWDMHHSGNPNVQPLEDVENAKRRLILAQMECPGGKLENQYIIGGGLMPNGKYQVSYVPKAQQDFCRGIVRDEQTGFAVVGNSASTGEQLEYGVIVLPTDPDDETEFSPSLLEQVRNYP
jgi:hypothetical protein